MSAPASHGMAEEVAHLLEETLNDIVKLNVALFFHHHPSAVEGTEQIASRLGRDPAGVEGALKALSQAGIVEQFELGSGRYVLYTYTKDAKLRGRIALLSQYYHDDPVLRTAIVRRLMGLPSGG